MGTGSGCIAVTLALSLSDSKVEAWDISTEALEIAQRNARKHNAHVNFFQRDILRYDVSELPEESLDIIVSNPPYIPDGDIAGLDVSVRDYEPHLALKGGADGLDFYRVIADKWRDALLPNGLMAFEVGIGQADEVLRIMRSVGFGDLEITPDLNGIPRVVEGVLHKEL